ncbi:MAG: protein kinase [Myxococcota bacterium]
METGRDPLIGRRLGVYEVERRLSTGGFGAVYAARHIRTGRKYALKVLRPDRAIVSPDARTRFRREADALGALGHAGIVAIHDYAREDGIDYLVMDLLDGEDLAARIERRGRLPMEEAFTLVAGMVDALDAAHRAKIVHRDLKPANIFLAHTPGEGERPVLLDFGLAKDTSGNAQSLTASGETLGTPAYMAPEQASASHVDERTDVYALGAVVYEMLAGVAPFEGNATSVLLQVMTTPPRPLRELVDVPDHVAAAVHRALEKDPGDRFPSVLAFRDALFRRGVEVPPTRPMPAPVIESGAPQSAVGARSTGSSFRRGLPVGLALGAVAVVAGVLWVTTSPEPEPVAMNAAAPTLVDGENVETSETETSVESAETESAETESAETESAESLESAETESAETEAVAEPTVETMRTARPTMRRRVAMTSMVGAPPPEPVDVASARPQPTRVEAPSERSTPPSDSEGDATRRAELRQLRGLLATVNQMRQGLQVLQRGQEPSFCRGQRRRAAGGSQLVVSEGQRLDRLRRRACEPFEAAREPDSEVRGLYRRFPDTLDRSQRMARENSSTNQPRAIAEQIDAAIDRARTAFGGVEEGRRPFPCDNPVWSELRRLSTSENNWAGTAARRVTQAQSRICQRLGLGRTRLSGVARTADTDLDDVEGSVRAAIRPLEAYLGEQG